MANILLIIGASSDIGLELIKHVSDDCLILAHYNKSKERLLDVVNKVENTIIPLQADISCAKEFDDFLDMVERDYGVPDKFVHLAAPKFDFIRFKDLKWNDVDYELNVSLRSLVVMLNRFIPKLTKMKVPGKVVCMLSSVTLNVPPKALSQYTMVKYAMLGLVKSLASEYADKAININDVSPSMIVTEPLLTVSLSYSEVTSPTVVPCIVTSSPSR